MRTQYCDNLEEVGKWNEGTLKIYLITQASIYWQGNRATILSEHNINVAALFERDQTTFAYSKNRTN